jgi:hypothetical protein
LNQEWPLRSRRPNPSPQRSRSAKRGSRLRRLSPDHFGDSFRCVRSFR